MTFAVLPFKITVCLGTKIGQHYIVLPNKRSKSLLLLLFNIILCPFILHISSFIRLKSQDDFIFLYMKTFVPMCAENLLNKKTKITPPQVKQTYLTVLTQTSMEYYRSFFSTMANMLSHDSHALMNHFHITGVL